MEYLYYENPIPKLLTRKKNATNKKKRRKGIFWACLCLPGLKAGTVAQLPITESLRKALTETSSEQVYNRTSVGWRNGSIAKSTKFCSQHPLPGTH